MQSSRQLFRVFKRQYSSKESKVNLLGLTLPELQQELTTVRNAKSYTALQLWQQIYRHGHNDFVTMTNLSKNLQAELLEKYTVYYGDIKLDKLAQDQTRKFLIGFNRDPRAIVETVIIPEPKRSTLCVSSQIGCSLNCSFCHTGTQKLERSLTAAEVVGQYMTAATQSGDFPLKDKRVISNMVFMGQGEPLYNWRQISKAIKILTDEKGIAWSKSKITVSTSGVVPLIPKIATELGVSLAISLHAVNNDLRDVLVPLNKMFPLETVLDACKQYAQSMGNRGRRITFEYVMLKNVNDSLAEARKMAKLLNQLPAHVNLIPFNPWPGSEYESTNMEQIERFANIVSLNGTHCTIRRPRGQDQQQVSFGIGGQNNTQGFGAQQQQPNTFGGSAQPSNTGFGGGGFGANATSGFGGAQTNNTPNTTGFGGLGNNTLSQPAANTGFGTSQPAAPSFGFGNTQPAANTGFGASSQPASGAPSFGFGSSQPAATSTPSFGFGTSQPAATSTPSFGFGTSQPAASGTTSFGLGTSQPAASGTTSFGFGSSQPAASGTTSFGFGSSQPAASGTTSFGFGSSQPAASGASSFGFGSSQPAASGASSFGFGASKPATGSTLFGSGASNPATIIQGQPATDPTTQGGLPSLDNCFAETGVYHFIARPDGITRSIITSDAYTAELDITDYNDQYNPASVPFTFSSPKPKELPRYLTTGLLTPGNGKRKTIDELITQMNEAGDKSSKHVSPYKPPAKTSKSILAEKKADPYYGFYRNLQKDVTIA